MAAPFARSLRSVENDGHGPSLLLVLGAALLLGLWGAWFTLARVSLRATSPSGRIVADRAVFPVQAGTSGSVIATPGLVLGNRVSRGDVLVELDARGEHLQLDEERARIRALERELAADERRLAALEESLEAAGEAGRAAGREAAARTVELEAGAELAEGELDRVLRLQELGGASELDVLRAQAEARRSRSVVEGHRHGLERMASEQRRLEQDRAAEIEALRAELVRLRGAVETAAVTVARIERRIAEKTLRAPADGEVADVASLGPGAFLDVGAPVAAIVSPARLKVVAEFRADEALGKLERGQEARLRFDGFPWSRYGFVHARVASIGREAREGSVQVELALDEERPTEVPLQHGLTCSVEVDLALISPAELVLRSAGKSAEGGGAAPTR